GRRAKHVPGTILVRAFSDSEDQEALRGDLAVRVQRELLPFLARELFLLGAGADQAAQGAVQVVQMRIGDLAGRERPLPYTDGQQVAGVGGRLREDDL